MEGKLTQSSEVISECLRKFPEISDHFSDEELRGATALGNYIFFEDYFNEFVAVHGRSEHFFQRVAAFVEKLAGSTDPEVQALAEIGLLEGLVNRQVLGVADHLGEHARRLLKDASRRTRFDEKIWLRSG